MTLHVLHDDDRVVHHDADREHHAEERQRVEREAEREHHGERADQRDRHRDERNDRRTPRLQEDHHDDDDEQNGFEERVHDRADRFTHVDRRVVDDLVVHAVRERLLQRLHRRADLR